MSARRAGPAEGAAKPLGKRVPEPAKPTPQKKPSTSARGKLPTGTVEGTAAAAQKLVVDIERALAEGRTDVLTVEAIQALMAAACRSYSAQVEASGNFPPLAARNRVTSTDIMVTASGLLKSANLAVFELGMWQSWTGR